MAIVGETSLVDSTWASYVATRGIPVVGGASFEQPFLTNPDFFPSGTQLLLNQFGVIQLAKQAGGTHIGVMYCAESPVCASLVPLASGAAKLYGLQNTAAKVAATAPNYTASCLAAKSAGVNVLYVPDNASVVQRLIRLRPAGLQAAGGQHGCRIFEHVADRPELRRDEALGVRRQPARHLAGAGRPVSGRCQAIRPRADLQQPVQP
jgi:hypothetical protein